MIKKNYLSYIHNLRGLAILIIVSIHARLALFPNDNIDVINRVLVVLLENGTVVYVFISGFLFHHVFASRLDYRKYLIRKTHVVVLPYLIASVLPILDKLLLDGEIPWMTPEIASSGNFGMIGYMLVTGKQFGPYWFIPMIVIFYIIAPILVVVNRKWFYLYLFPIIFVGGLFTYQFGYYSTILNSFIYFLPVYLLGMFVSQYKKYFFNWQRVLLPILIGVYIALLIVEFTNVLDSPRFIGFNTEEKPYFIFNPAKLHYSILSVILLLVFHIIESKKIALFDVLGDYSFGIYFVHLYFIIIIMKVLQFIQLEFSPNLISFLTLTLVATFLSMTYVWVMKLIFKNNSRYIIGS
jgi:peptidoglycan/LPS O-acetylase OafA/YrhL